MARKKIGALLEEKGYINEFQLVAALSHQRKWKSKLGQSLIELGYLEEDKLFEVLAEQLDLPYLNLRGVQVAPEVLRRVTKDFAREWLAVPIAYDGAAWTVAVCEPDKPNLINALSATLNGPVKISLSTPTAIETLTRKIPDKVAVGTVQPVKKAFVRNGNGAFVPAPDDSMPLLGDPTPPPRPAPPVPPVATPAPPDPAAADGLLPPLEAPPVVPNPEAPLEVGEIPSASAPAAEDEVLAMPDDELALPVDEPEVRETVTLETVEAPELDLPPLAPLTAPDLPPTDDDLRLEEPVEEPMAMPESIAPLPVEAPPEIAAADTLPSMDLEAPALDLPPMPAVEAPSLNPDDEPLAMPGEESETGPEAPPALDLPEVETMEIEPDFQGGSVPVAPGGPDAVEPETPGEVFPTEQDDQVPLESPNETAAALSGESDSEAMSLDEILAPPTETLEIEYASAPPLADDLPGLSLSNGPGLPPLDDDRLSTVEPMALETLPPSGSESPELSLPDTSPAMTSETPPPLDLQPPSWPAPAEPEPEAAASNIFDTDGLFDPQPPLSGATAVPLAGPGSPSEPEAPPVEILSPPPAGPEPLPVMEPPPDLGDEVMEIPEPEPVAAAPVSEPEADPATDEDTVALMNQIKALETQIAGMNGVLQNLKGMLQDRKGKKS